MRVLKQSTARTITVFLVSSADHISGLSGATLSITLSKNGGAFAAYVPGFAPTDLGNGWYSFVLDATATNTLGDLAMRITAASADSIDAIMQVVAYDPIDAVRLGLSALPNAAANAANGLITFGTGSGQLNVSGGRGDSDVQRWRGSQPTTLSAGSRVPSDVQTWLNSAPAALTASGFVQVALLRWLTDNAAGTPAALSATTKLVQVLLSRWATDDAAGTVITPAVAGVPKVDLTHWLGTAVDTPDNPGVPNVNVIEWLGDGVAATTVPGVPEVDTTHFGGTVAPAPSVPGIPLTESGGGGGGGGGGGVNPSLVSKIQFVSNEDLQVVFPPFIDMSTGTRHIGTDAVTLVVKRPNGTLLGVPPVPTFDTDVQLWVATIPFSSFMEGKWMIKATSDGSGTLPQNQVLTWGDYVDDIPETRQAALGRWKIDAVSKKLFLFEDDGVTVFKEFDLKDASGTPSTSQVFERDPV